MFQGKKIGQVKERGIGYKLFIIFSLTTILPALISSYLIINYNLPEEYSKYQLIILLSLEVVIIFLGIYLSSTMAGSIMKAISAIKEVAEGNVSKRLTESAREEISGLAMNFNRITSNLENTIKNLEASEEQMRRMLFRIGNIIASPVDIDKVMQILLSTTVHVLEGDKGFFFMQDDEKGVMSLLVNVNATDEDLKYYENWREEGIIKKVIREKKSVRISINNTIEVNEVLCPIDKSKTSISAPIILGNRVIGVISLADKKNGGEYLEDELFLLENLSSQIAMALENSRLRKNAEKSYFETIIALATAVDSRDEYTIGHSKQVAKYAIGIAKNMGLAQSDIDVLRDAALLHDIGKIGMPDDLLRNTDELTNDEKDLVWKHPVTGENILKPIESLSKLCPIVRHHHERYDGKGYPDGLKGKDIPLLARIIMLADAYDAMRSDRSYQKGQSSEEAIEEIKKYSGFQFDPLCVKTFVEYLETSIEN
ncbi:MAG: hypothetical protein A2043_09960 [Candidatus Schekmanbacteria bacterium GWA2_38_9]|uniref:HD-GYP domain-containing protein n=1 Tax=Candidatus Schekmanbacteria bacterium RIFCSPLOWO2_12_FULL_38_15 TaxID=1817883 RepID=A0A1F7SMP4_9BACT|nr:MAG: hypothetical protein A2043_09960 [Candidatus Schekmanbacteria bacterium GWA2_38_9]OGL48007.1 MAG: hypothetical protein A3H37_08255 [Candidatus Schekmanbacteria bacterium RIFCSPLOWO2_02_FULL_38_14]OGL54508.1 MAG: hypothetical protein A3G31_10135 [Candidatus Schekmanbacteria bacterium RIFCSPLOWO2_12_FULL_38_15]